VKNRRNAGSHPQEIVAELKSKNNRTAKIYRFYRAEIVARKTLTGQLCPDIDIRFDQVTLVLTTHDADGLTENDFTLAEQCDEEFDTLVEA
jgi:pterin-4a-carbinolamine dehydratase